MTILTLLLAAQAMTPAELWDGAAPVLVISDSIAAAE